MPISEHLLEILVCPRTRTAVKTVPDAEVQRLNELIAARRLHYADGSVVEQSLEEALVTVDGKTVYRIDDGIAVMLIERGIVLEAGGEGGKQDG
ncbi:MAG: Trm112 family protein [Planctomycetes bacterium]|nr:Trm112 family protein [Planctomycetota bacterium]